MTNQDCPASTSANQTQAVCMPASVMPAAGVSTHWSPAVSDVTQSLTAVSSDAPVQSLPYSLPDDMSYVIVSADQSQLSSHSTSDLQSMIFSASPTTLVSLSSNQNPLLSAVTTSTNEDQAVKSAAEQVHPVRVTASWVPNVVMTSSAGTSSETSGEQTVVKAEISSPAKQSLTLNHVTHKVQCCLRQRKLIHLLVLAGEVGIGPKLGQIGPKYGTKLGLFKISLCTEN